MRRALLSLVLLLSPVAWDATPAVAAPCVATPSQSCNFPCNHPSRLTATMKVPGAARIRGCGNAEKLCTTIVATTCRLDSKSNDDQWVCASEIGNVTCTVGAVGNAQVGGYNDGDEGVVDLLYGAGPPAGAVVLHANCGFHAQYEPNSNYPVLIAAGHAAAVPTTTNRPVVVAIRCVIRDWQAGYDVIDTEFANEGAQTTTVPPAVARPQGAAFEVCGAAWGYLQDGTVIGSPSLECLPPELPF